MALPEGLTYGQVRWRAVTPLADGADPDGLPDAQPVSGTVTFTPSTNELLVSGGTAPVTVISASLVFQLDEDGVLRDGENRDTVTLMATDNPDVSPVNWTWRADYRLFGGASRGSFSFALPGGATVDLTTVAPVSSSNGTPIIRGPEGPPGAPGVTAEELDAWGASLGTKEATPNTVVRRDVDGDALFHYVGSGAMGVDDAPSAPFHVTRKDYVDALGTAGTSGEALPTTIMRRNGSGNTRVNNVFIDSAPTAVNHATRKDYVDALGTPDSTANTVVRRDQFGDFSGRAVFTYRATAQQAPSSADELTRKDYVDGQIATRIPSFADPNADRIVFWDDSVGAYAALTASTGLTISGTSMTVRTANETQTGIVELATAAETTTGTDATRAVHPAGLKVELDKKVANGGGVASIVTLTQAAYDGLGTKVATTLYVIVG